MATMPLRHALPCRHTTPFTVLIRRHFFTSFFDIVYRQRFTLLSAYFSLACVTSWRLRLHTIIAPASHIAVYSLSFRAMPLRHTPLLATVNIARHTPPLLLHIRRCCCCLLPPLPLILLQPLIRCYYYIRYEIIDATLIALL